MAGFGAVPPQPFSYGLAAISGNTAQDSPRPRSSHRTQVLKHDPPLDSPRAARPDPTLPWCDGRAPYHADTVIPGLTLPHAARMSLGNGNLEAAGRLGAGDILVADSNHRTYWLLANVAAAVCLS